MVVEKNIYIDDILAQYFPADSWETWVGQRGANNTTRFVRVDDNPFVLRVYETHQDVDKVKYEHAILAALAEMPLTFSIPKPIRTRDGKTIVRTRDGKIAGLFQYLDGVNPALDELAEIQSYGRTAGLLSASLAHVQIQQRPAYRPYYEIESTHPSCSLEDVLSFCKKPPSEFSEHTTDLFVIYEQLTSFTEQVTTLRHLPHQLVHGDLNASNILVNKDGMVSAVLDFEFVTNDLRVMELAVCLSDFIQPSEEETITWAKIDAFLSGYGKSLILTEAEIEAVPVLIQLRSLDVFIHFLGRYLDQVSSIDIVKEYIQKSAIRCNWIIDNKNKLITFCTTNLLDGNS
ncbi:homoserine kinase type II [Neobacillus niacini]|jgi:homoserine kinase type II|uniref:phosphotransferase n=1 Tax=Neobacillus niacini TaxID=86668 RepID=UPI00277D1762|nr:phosphotransferase [Neobacillus niacini]MDQ1002963.1 homoserine kinase type II [Neobacillus niacini]